MDLEPVTSDRSRLGLKKRMQTFSGPVTDLGPKWVRVGLHSVIRSCTWSFKLRLAELDRWTFIDHLWENGI